MPKDEEPPRRRSFVFSKRLNIGNPERPQSLISYDSPAPVVAPTTPVNVAPAIIATGGAKAIPPVLARARAVNLNVVLPNVDSSSNLPTTRRPSLGPIEDLVICAICLDRLSTPKMLSCQHTFCLSCLLSQLGVKDSIKCPTCRSEQKVSNKSDVHNLPSNLYMDSLLQLLRDSSHSPSNLQLNSDLENRCIKCQIICNNDNKHKCRHCKQIFCTICWDGHLTELSSQINKLDDQLVSAVTKIEHKLDEFKDKVETLQKHIGSYVEGQIVLLKEKEIALRDEATFLLDSELELSKPLIKRIESLKISIRNSTNDTSDRVASFMSFHQEASEIFSEINKLGDRKASFNRENFSIEVHNDADDSDEDEVNDIGNDVKGLPSNSSKTNPLESIDTLKHYYLNKTFKPKFIWNKCARPAGVAMSQWVHMESGLKLLYVAGSDSRLIYGIETVKGRIVHRISHDEMIFPNSLACSASRREIFVTDKWKHCVFVFSENGELLRTLCNKGDMEGYLRSPEGIAIHGNMMIVCDTGNDRVQCLDIMTGKMLMQFGVIRREQLIASANNRTTSVLADLKTPTGVCYYEDHFIIMDSGNRRVKIFNRKGEKLSEFGSIGTGAGQFKHPEVLAIDQLGFIYVGDGGNTRIQIFQPNGKLVNSFGLRGNSVGKFGWISGICVTSDLQIIVSDYKNHSVQIFQ